MLRGPRGLLKQRWNRKTGQTLSGWRRPLAAVGENAKGKKSGGVETCLSIPPWGRDGLSALYHLSPPESVPCHAMPCGLGTGEHEDGTRHRDEAQTLPAAITKLKPVRASLAQMKQRRPTMSLVYKGASVWSGGRRVCVWDRRWAQNEGECAVSMCA